MYQGYFIFFNLIYQWFHWTTLVLCRTISCSPRRMWLASKLYKLLRLYIG